MKFCANDAKNVTSIGNMLIYCLYYQHVLGVKNKYLSYKGGFSTFGGHFFDLYGVQVIDNSKDLKSNISVLMRVNRVKVQ